MTANKIKILIMDDEEPIRYTTGELLKDMGYDSMITGDGFEAISIYKKEMERGRHFDIIILDLIVPGGMGGEETMRKLLEIDNEVKVILTSGNLDDPILKNFREYGFTDVILKPYSIEELAKILRSIIT
ncbi:MAG: response regulator [Planctomycetes bacterium]|nr:response regulator [Planctomycetota bacterium]